jgi:hypothetical protein
MLPTRSGEHIGMHTRLMRPLNGERRNDERFPDTVPTPVHQKHFAG